MILPKPLIAALVRVQEKEPSRFHKVRLDRSERTHPFSDQFVDRVRRLLDGEWIMTYPEPEALYSKMASFLGQPRERLLFNSGSDQSIKALFETYVVPGDGVLLHRPGYAMYPVYAQMFGAHVISQDFDEDLRFDFGAYLDKINGSIRMAVLENPNGFIGSAPSADILRRFVDKCEREGVLAVVDEAYYFFHDVTAAQWLDLYENLVVVRTFSKALGGAGLRAGYTLARPAIIDSLFKVKPMHEINSLAVLVLGELLGMPEEIHSFVRATRDSLTVLKSGLSAMGLRVSPSVANFLAAELGAKISGAKASHILRERGILLRRPFREAHLSKWTRIGTGPVSIMREVLDVLSQLISRQEGSHGPV